MSRSVTTCSSASSVVVGAAPPPDEKEEEEVFPPQEGAPSFLVAATPLAGTAGATAGAAAAGSPSHAESTADENLLPGSSSAVEVRSLSTTDTSTAEEDPGYFFASSAS